MSYLDIKGKNAIFNVKTFCTIDLKAESGVLSTYAYSDSYRVFFWQQLMLNIQMFASERFCLTDSVVTAMQAILLPREDNISALQQVLPPYDDGNSMANQVHVLRMSVQYLVYTMGY